MDLPWRIAAIRSSPMPVSIDGRGRSTTLRILRDLLRLHENEIPDLDEPVAVLIGAAGGTTGDVPRRDRKKISEHGPHGPVSPIAQKLSLVAMRMMR